MAVIVLSDKLTSKDIVIAREDYDTYIKITIDIEKGLVAIGGQYHADAQKILIEKFGSKKEIWGGGYSITRKQYEANALINIRPDKNPSMEILDQIIRDKFLVIAKNALKDIESLV